MLQSRIASKGSMNYYIFRERLTEKKAAPNRVHGRINWSAEVWDLYLQGEAAFSSSVAPKPGVQHMIGTSMCWHKSPWIIQIHNTPLSQTKRTCPSQYYQTSCEPSFSEGRGMDSIAFSRLSVSVACSTRIYRRKILTQRSYCRHRSTGSLYPKHNVF